MKRKLYPPFYLVCLLFLIKGTTNGQSVSKYIVTDQFGYLPDAPKIAVLRDPVIGYDAAESFTPGASYAVVDKGGQQVFKGAPILWNQGALDSTSGDKAWWFDFSAVTTPGEYYILDVTKNVRSYAFEIREDIYNDILKHAVRTFFYQRAGHEKKAIYAGEAWADGASHVQDKRARAFNDKSNAAKEKDVSGGWYDAGDYNKYTNWTASYVVQMMLAYLEKPEAWADDYNIPESGNGIPDLLDEARWGIDHLLRMQQKDGSVISIASLSHASPPSGATGTTFYGDINTSSAHSVATAFAIASKVFRGLGEAAYADTLLKRARFSWEWSAANPDVIWKNNDAEYGSSGIGAGQQEQGDYDRQMGRLKAAIFLFDATGEAVFKNYVDANYTNAHLLQWTYAYPFEGELQDALIYYAHLPGATTSTRTAIQNAYKSSMNTGSFADYNSKRDPYRAHLNDYTWGSNNTKSTQGTMFYNTVSYRVDTAKSTLSKQAALGFINYIHGVNPLSFVYLSNMYAYGADNGVNEFYHTWFADKSAKWDRVGTSLYGPAPGFLTGGANPSYDVDACCASGCNGNSCTTELLSPPKGQPKQKSYKDFNTNWPLNSWAVTENSNGYQVSYIRLLSKFVQPAITTGLTDGDEINENSIYLFPNPTTGTVTVGNLPVRNFLVSVSDVTGKVFKTFKMEDNMREIDLSELQAGSYILKLTFGHRIVVKHLSKL